MQTRESMEEEDVLIETLPGTVIFVFRPDERYMAAYMLTSAAYVCDGDDSCKLSDIAKSLTGTGELQ